MAPQCFVFKTELVGDFPGGPMIKNPPCNAGDVGSIPGWGTKMPHAAEKLSLRATTRESGLEIPHAIAKT